VLKQIENRARVENRPVNELVADFLQRSFGSVTENPEQVAMAQEMASYQAMHQQLLGKYENQYVAVFGGQVVDHDSDQMALLKRRLKNYPNETVLITQVRPEPIRTLRIRSPRLIRIAS
jgi:hypothetical protein